MPRETALIPSAPTLWRTMHLDISVQEQLVKTTTLVQPSLRQRDAGKIQRVEQAADVAAVLDLAPVAGGLAEYPWLKRMWAFGASAAPEVVARVNSDWMRAHRQEVQERLIAALRWYGPAGAQALTDCWDAFDDYGRSLACVVLGLLDAHASADRLYTFLEGTRSNPGTHWVGALWGLIDLGDARAADALLQSLLEKRPFYERYGFLSRAGDRRAVQPLIFAVLDVPQAQRVDPMWALTGIGHRLGREGLAEALRVGKDPAQTSAETIEPLIEGVFMHSQQDVERHFETFYNRHPSFWPNAVGQ